MKETKSLKFEVKSTEIVDNSFIFEGYASVFNNVDLGDDIIEKGSFKKSLIENPQVPVLWQHQMAEPIGISAELQEDELGLYIKAKLPKDDDLVRGRVIPQMKIGSIKEMSIGFFTKDFVMDKTIRRIKEIMLYEVSLVTKAMNPLAKVLDFKSLETINDIEILLRDRGFSQNEAKTLISKIKKFSKQREADEIDQRDVEIKNQIITDLHNFINNKLK